MKGLAARLSMTIFMKTGTQTDYLFQKYSIEEAFDFIAEAGFKDVDYNIFIKSERELLTTLSYGEIERRYSDIARIAGTAGVGFSQTHTPFPTSSGDDAKQRDITDLQRKSIIATGALGCNYAVIHPQSLNGCIDGKLSVEAKERNMEFYASLEDLLRECGVYACIENMFATDPETGAIRPTRCSSAEEILDYIDTLGSDRFVACLDTGHANLTGTTPAAMARILGKKLKVLHVHDNDGLRDSHLMPYFGNIDWNDFASALREIGYDGTLSLEADNTYRFARFGELEKATAKLMYASAAKIAAMAE